MVPLRVASPLGTTAVAVPALLDTGADSTVIPQSLARRLRLPAVGIVRVTGVTGTIRRSHVYAARLDVGGLSLVARVVGLGREAIIGRDLLSRLVVSLDGPRCMTTLRFK